MEINRWKVTSYVADERKWCFSMKHLRDIVADKWFPFLLDTIWLLFLTVHWATVIFSHRAALIAVMNGLDNCAFFCFVSQLIISLCFLTFIWKLKNKTPFSGAWWLPRTLADCSVIHVIEILKFCELMHCRRWQNSEPQAKVAMVTV